VPSSRVFLLATAVLCALLCGSLRAQQAAASGRQAPASAAAVQAARSDARAEWKLWGAALTASFRSGQCTDLTERARPGIVRAVYEAVWTRANLAGNPAPAEPNFDARNWATLARAAGLALSASPRVGAVVVWQPGVENADRPSGHVGLVTRVSGGTFTTREENVGVPYRYGSRTLSAAPLSGRVFILP